MTPLAQAMAHFAHVAPISSHTRATLAPHLPPLGQELFTYGVGYIGDGLLRTVDPITIARAVVDLAAPIHASHSFPILTTAFGDVVTEWRSRCTSSMLGWGATSGWAGQAGSLRSSRSSPTPSGAHSCSAGPRGRKPWAVWGCPHPGSASPTSRRCPSFPAGRAR